MDPTIRCTTAGATRFPRTRGDGPDSIKCGLPSRTFPPHARGWTRDGACPTPPQGVSPARAGMDHGPRPASGGSSGFPRTRGDGPAGPVHIYSGDGFPPHARGWTCRPCPHLQPRWVSPARAGMDLPALPALSTSTAAMGFPRTRGDGPAGPVHIYSGDGFPPHARGWTVVTRARQAIERVSPARAGMDRRDPGAAGHRAGFPRTRGDGPCRLRSPTPRGPFPPHARGWTLTPRPVLGPDRVSPARAGMDPSHPAGPSSPRRFPRTRGDGPPQEGDISFSTVFPPHARGWTRAYPLLFTTPQVSPARAGMDPNTALPVRPRRGFPRTRGDGPFSSRRAFFSAAFPPHARGWTPSRGRHLVLHGVSPARAGMDPGLPPTFHHPSGFPPHARGWTQTRLSRCGRAVVSPARAGMDPPRPARSPRHRCFPRTRGDGPDRGAAIDPPRWFPPHARGWTVASSSRARDRTVSPARAGMDRSRQPFAASFARFPRTRGDGPEGGADDPGDGLFPPHARGWTRANIIQTTGTIVSPARAGMDPRRADLRAMPQRFPRTRGDGPSRAAYWCPRLSFPPHARGWTGDNIRVTHVTKVSPARAGMDPQRTKTCRVR